VRLLTLLGSLLLLAGCVVVDEPSRERAPLPSGAVQPALGADTSSIRVETALLPLGKVAYDGQVLPIVSPDGRHLAVQIGAAPTWGALLAKDESLTPLGSRLAVYELGQQGMALLYESSAGLLLGRTATNGAVLVEQPNRDGSRWIGLMDWRSGAIDWVNQDERVNAFAHSNGRRIAWSRRSIGSETWDLVIQEGTGRHTIAAEGGKWLFPVFSARSDLLYALYIDPSERLHVVALRLSTLLNEHEIVAETVIASGATAALAFQTFAALQDPGGSSLAGVGSDSTSNPGLLLFHPGHQRIGRFDPNRGGVQLFDPRTLGATWLTDREVVLTTAKAVLLRSLLAKESIGPVLRSTYLARSTPGHPMRVLLLGPGGSNDARGVPDELTVVRLGLPRDESG
jgi:hypothetical protein